MEIALLLLVIAVIFVVSSIKIVPQQNAWVIERLGKYHATLTPGLNFLVPFVDRLAYKHSLKEIPLDVPSQVCITKDNTQLTVDGILYFQVTDAMRASYGSSNFIVAITQLAQTTLRSVIGRMELDRTFEERAIINTSVVEALDDLEVGAPVERQDHVAGAEAGVYPTVDEVRAEQPPDALGGAGQSIRSGGEADVVQAHAQILGPCPAGPDTGVRFS